VGKRVLVNCFMVPGLLSFSGYAEPPNIRGFSIH